MKITTLEFTGQPMQVKAADGGITVSLPISIKRYSGRRQIVVPQGMASALSSECTPTTLQASLARGHRWLRMIESGKVANIAELAAKEKADRSYVSRMINLTTLAPEIVAAILDETLPGNISLFDLASNTPLSWEEQREKMIHVSS